LGFINIDKNFNYNNAIPLVPAFDPVKNNTGPNLRM